MNSSKILYGLTTKLRLPFIGSHVKVIRAFSSWHNNHNSVINTPQKRCLSTGNPPSGSGNENQKTYKWQMIAGISFIAGVVIYALKKGDDSSSTAKGSKSETPKKKPEVSLKPKVNIPEHVPYLLIGAGTASFSAFRAIKSNDPTAKVLVIGEEDAYPYMRPPLSKELWFSKDPANIKNLQFKQWNGKERSIYFEHEEFYCSPTELGERENGGVAVVRGYKITKIEPHARTATLDSGQTITYDKCLIATGGKPKNLAIFEKAEKFIQERVVLFRNVNDFWKLEKIANTASSITIVGGGFLGSELACALGTRARDGKLKVNQVFPESGNMGSVLPEYLSLWTTEKVKTEGVNVLPHETVNGVASKGRQIVLKLSNDKELLTDYVVVAVGIDPKSDLALESGLELDPKLKGYVVNAELEARSNLYVAGDAACFYDVHLGRRRVEHHDHAVVSGRLAGENMAGANKHYTHQSMFWSDLGPDVGYEAIGIVDSSLPTVGIFAKATEKDTPKAVVEASGQGVRSEMEENAVPPTPSNDSVSEKPQGNGDQYGKGIIFYLRDDVIVGLVMWNVFNRMPIARKIIKEKYKRDDISEISKLFNLHAEE